MRACVPPSTAEGSGSMRPRPLRRAIPSYGFIPKRGGPHRTAILARRFPFVGGPGHSHGRDCSGTSRARPVFAFMRQYPVVLHESRPFLHTASYEARRYPLGRRTTHTYSRRYQPATAGRAPTGGAAQGVSGPARSFPFIRLHTKAPSGAGERPHSFGS